MYIPSPPAYDVLLIGTSLTFGRNVCRHRCHFAWQMTAYAAAASVLFRTVRLLSGRSHRLLPFVEPLFWHDLLSASLAFAVTFAGESCLSVRKRMGLAALLFALAWYVKMVHAERLMLSRCLHAAGHACVVLASATVPM